MHFTQHKAREKKNNCFYRLLYRRHYTGKLKYIAKIKQKMQMPFAQSERKNNASLSCFETKKLGIITGADNRIHVDTAPIHWPAPFLDLGLR